MFIRHFNGAFTVTFTIFCIFYCVACIAFYYISTTWWFWRLQLSVEL